MSPLGSLAIVGGILRQGCQNLLVGGVRTNHGDHLIDSILVSVAD